MSDEMSVQAYRCKGSLATPRYKLHGVWLCLALQVSTASPSLMAKQPSPARDHTATSHAAEVAWLPDAGTWRELSTDLFDVMARVARHEADASWHATHCTVYSHGGLDTCTELSLTTTQWQINGDRITWRRDGTLKEVEGLEVLAGDLSFGVQHGKLDAGASSTFSGVQGQHQSSTLTLHIATWQIDAEATHRFEELSWSPQTGPRVLATCDVATLEQEAWRVESLRYSTWIRRQELTTHELAPITRGLLSPRLQWSEGRFLVGEEAVMASVGARALFAGIFGMPGSASYGLSMGVTTPVEVSKAHETWPLRLQVGVDDEGLSASLQGDAMWNLGAGNRLDVHLEEGAAAWTTQDVYAQQGGLRSWRQSRAGVALGSEETILQVAGVHDPSSRQWSATLMAGGRYIMSRRGALEFALDHTSHIKDVDTQVHQSEVTPGWTTTWGAREHLSASIFGGLHLTQTSEESAESMGITTANQMTALGMGQVTASLEGRFASLTHRLEPQLQAFAAPLSWSRRPTGVDDEDQTRAVQTESMHQLGGTVTLAQELTGASGRMGVEAPVSALGMQSAAWGEASRQRTVASTMAMTAFYRSREGVQLGAGAWLGVMREPEGSVQRMASWHAQVSRGARWRVSYVYGDVMGERLALRWLTMPHQQPSAVRAGIWQDAIEAHSTETSETSAHGVTAGVSVGALECDMIGYWGDASRWGGRASVGYRLMRTGWRLMGQTSYRREVEDEYIGVGVSWRE